MARRDRRTLTGSLLCVLAAAGAAAQTTAPAAGPGAPASAPGPGRLLPEAASGPARLPIPQVDSVEQVLQYTETERTTFADVHDGDGTISTAALYWLLYRSAMLPKDRRTLAEADAPSLKNLFREPQRHRAQLVRIRAKYLGHSDWTGDSARSYPWGDRPVHLWYLVSRELDPQRRIMLATSAPPPAWVRRGLPLDVAGLYYKLVRIEDDPGEGGAPVKVREYAIVAVGPVFRAGGAGVADVPPHVLGMFGAVVLLLVGFFVLRARTRRAAKGEQRRYQPLRFEDVLDRPPPDEPEVDDGPVDEELIRQVRAYQAEHRPSADDEHGHHRQDSR